MGGLRRWFGWSAVTLVPLLALAGLLANALPDPTWVGPVFHFVIVSLTALLAIGLAILMAIAAGQLREARVFFLALAFLAIAGVFLVHGLTTPGALIHDDNPWVGFSGYLSLLLGAIFLALSAVDWPPAVQRAIGERQGRILGLFLVALLAYGAVAMLTSARGPDADGDEYGQGQAHAAAAPAGGSGSGLGGVGYGTVAGHDEYGHGQAHAPAPAPGGGYGYGRSDNPAVGGNGAATSPAAGPGATTAAHSPLLTFLTTLATPIRSWVLAGFTLALLALVIVRYALLYRMTRLPLLAGFLASAIFLAQAQLAMVTTAVWHASWWEYHGLLVAALTAAIVGLGAEYARGGSLQDVLAGLLLRDTIRQLERGYAEVIVALVSAVEAKDPYTRGHTQRVAELAVLIGRELKLSPERLRILGQAAMLHDIGKIGVPDAILNKPGPLTAEEFAIVKDHPARGHEIIKGVRSLHQEIGGVRSHHERLDGTGYPDGLAGDAIPLDARIIAVGDVYDALTSNRSYRAAWSPERALAVLDAEAGSKLDARCVRALRRVLEARTEHSRAAQEGSPLIRQTAVACARPPQTRPRLRRPGHSLTDPAP